MYLPSVPTQFSGCDNFFSSGSPMGQPNTVIQLADGARFLNPKFDVVKNWLAEPFKEI